jgi:hypothetical protein
MTESTLPIHILNATAAQRNNSKEVYLTKAQRNSVDTEILTSNAPGTKGLNLKNVPDVWVCRMLLNVRAVLYANKALGVDFRGLPRQLLAKGYRP